MAKRSAVILEEAGAASDRRSHKRQTMVLRVGILNHEDRTSFCLVKNISPLGVQVKLFGQLVVGSEVGLRIGDEDPLPGRAVWVRDQLAGIAFASALEPRALLRVTQKLSDERRRSTPRINAVARAIVRTGGQTYSAELLDISTSGARVRTRKPIAPGASIMMTLTDMPSLKAYVRWADECELGLVFEAPIPIQIMANWLEGRVTVSG